MELKTLKDLKIFYFEDKKTKKVNEEGILEVEWNAFIKRKDIKAEAIKWVKYHGGYTAFTKLLIEFHNITEDDLK